MNSVTCDRQQGSYNEKSLYSVTAVMSLIVCIFWLGEAGCSGWGLELPARPPKHTNLSQISHREPLRRREGFKHILIFYTFVWDVYPIYLISNMYHIVLSRGVLCKSLGEGVLQGH